MSFHRSLALGLLVVVSPLVRNAIALDPSEAGVASTFSLSHQAQVPGEVLKPGDYSIQIVEHISDRMIVRIDGAQGKEHLLLLAVLNPDANSNSSAPGLQTWRSGVGSLPTLRGFNFAGGTAVDFVYPKADAAALAKANAATIIAIDPESEGRPRSLKNLSSDDMREINLWMLTLTSTGPADNKVPALEAKRYQAPSASSTNTAAVAGSTTPARAIPQGSANPQEQVARLETPRAATNGVARKRAVTELPHTASLTPVLWLAGLVSFLGAGLIFLVRSLFGGTVSAR